MTQRRFYGLILDAVRNAGPDGAATRDIYDAVRTSGVHEREAEERGLPLGEYDWKHSVRCALQHLKQHGIIELIDSRWRLATDTANRVIENEPSCETEYAEAESLVLSSVLLDDLEIDTRLRNCLGRYGVETAGDVLAVREEDFADLSGVGEKTLRLLSELQKQLLSGPIETSGSHSEGTGQQDDLPLTSSLDGQRMSVRLTNRLDRYGANSLADALAVDDEDFLRIPGVGKNTLRELHRLQQQIIRLVGLHRNPAALHEVECGHGGVLADPIAGLPIKSVTQVAALHELAAEVGARRLGELFDKGRELREAAAARSPDCSAELNRLIERIRRIDKNYRARIGFARESAFPPDDARASSGATLLDESVDDLGDTSSLTELLRSHVGVCLVGRVSVREADCILRRFALSPGISKRPRLDELATETGIDRERIKELVALADSRCANSQSRQRLAPLLKVVRSLFEDDTSPRHIDEVRDALHRAFGWSARPTRNDVRLIVSWMPDIELTGTTTVKRVEDIGALHTLAASVESLGLSVRLRKRLERYGAVSVSDILAVDDEAFSEIAGVGTQTLDELHSWQDRIIRQTGMHRAPEEFNAVYCREDRVLAEPIAHIPARLLTEDSTLGRFLDENHTTVEELLDRQPGLEGRLAGVSRAAVDSFSALVEKIDLMDRNYRARIGHPGGPLAEQVEKRMYTVSTSLRETLVSYVETSLSDTTDRNRQIVLERLGLCSDYGQEPTLDDIAERYDLTRARVGQIANKWSERLSDSRYAARLSRLKEEVLSILGENLGLAQVDEVASKITEAFEWSEKPQRHEIELLCECMPDITMSSEGAICHDGVCHELEREVKEAAVELAAQNGTSRKLVNFAHDISDALRGRCYGSHRGEVFEHCGLDDNAGNSVLPLGYLRCFLAECDPPILDAEAEEVVSPDLWRLRFSETRQEVVHATLKLLGRPTHYAEVAAYVRDNSRTMSDISDAAVQRALQSASECVSVDRGVYALAEWDVERELTHGDAIEKLLREKGQPLPKSRIIRILTTQGYNENSLKASLDQQRFVEVGGDVYDLRDRHKASPTKGNCGVSIRGRKRKSTRIQI